MTDDKERQYYIHVDCALASMTQIHNQRFRQDVKNRPAARGKGRPKKKLHAGDDAGYCNFCGLLTAKQESYVREGKKRFHHPGKTGCWERYKQSLGRIKETLA
jgi:hypothetical protein